jgi:hypothetical protein
MSGRFLKAALKNLAGTLKINQNGGRSNIQSVAARGVSKRVRAVIA